MTRTAGAALRAHLDEILVIAVLAGAIVWFLNVDASTTSHTRGLVVAPTELDAGADRRYLDDMTVAIESAPVRRATAEATGLTVDQVISRLTVGPRIEGRIVQVDDRAVGHDPELAQQVISTSVEAAHEIALAPPTDEEVRRTIANLGERLDQVVELIRRPAIDSAALVEMDDELLEVRSALSQEQVATRADAEAIEELAVQAGRAIEDALADPFVDESDLAQSLTTARDDVRRLSAAVTTLDPDSEAQLEIGPTVQQQSLERPFGAAVLAGLAGLAAASIVAVAWQYRADRKREAQGDLHAYKSVSIDERLSDHLPADRTSA
jgi:hypothetical protein